MTGYVISPFTVSGRTRRNIQSHRGQRDRVVYFMELTEYGSQGYGVTGQLVASGRAAGLSE